MPFMSRPWTLAGRTIRPGNVGSGNRVYSLPPSGNRDILDNTLLERRRGSVKLTSHGIAGRLHPFRDIGREVVGPFAGPQRFAFRETASDDGPTHQCSTITQKPPARCRGNILIDVGWLGHCTRAALSAPPSRSTNHAAEIAAPESRVLVREHVGLDVAECRVGLAFDPVVERLDDVFLECSERGWACTMASRSSSLYSA